MWEWHLPRRNVGCIRAPRFARNEDNGCVPDQAFLSPTEERFQRVARLAARVFGLSGASVLLVSGRQEWFRERHRVQLDSTPRIDALAARVVRQREAIEISQGDPKSSDPPFYIGVPLRTPDGTTVGVLSVTDVRPRPVRADDLALMRDLAAILEDELSRMELSSAQRGLMEELSDARRRALVDPLTRVWNRAGLDELLQREVKLARMSGHALSVAMIDLDHFKQVNDTHGHSVGDRILQSVADRLRLTARPGDSVSRYGGEEFVVVLPGCTRADAPQVAERFRARVHDEALGLPPGPYVRVTVSVGVATLAEGEDAALLLHRSDTALYAAKRAGRDCVKVAEVDGVGVSMMRP